MIYLNFEHSKNPNYLGAREINRNSITLGPEGTLYVDSEIFPFPEISIKIQSGKLIFQTEPGDYYLKHNGKRTKLPIVAIKGDKIEFEDFRIAILDFKKVKYSSYRNFTSQALEQTQNNPSLLNLVTKLTGYLD